MANVNVFNMNGDNVGSIELNDSIFAVEVNAHVMHQAVVQLLANKRQGTQSALTRAEVRGGGRKPWRQKGTGRARQGSIRSPQWTGGGVVFAPKPRDYSFKLNKKVKRLALKSALSSKVNEGKLIVLDDLTVEGKTKEMVAVLKNLNANKALVVTKTINRSAEDVDMNEVTKLEKINLASRNIPTVKAASVNTMNVYDLLKFDSLVLTKDAVKQIEEVYA